MDLDRPGRRPLHSGNVDGQAAIAVQRFRLILELVAGAIGHTGDIKEQGVIGAVRTGILDGDVAMDVHGTLPTRRLGVEALGNVDDPILRDRDLGIEASAMCQSLAVAGCNEEQEREVSRER